MTKSIQQYIAQITGQDIKLKQVEPSQLNRLPMYLRSSFDYHYTKLLGVDIVLIAPKNIQDYTIGTLESLLNQLHKFFDQKLVLWFNNLAAYQRKRLIEKRINFIVENKQLYLPDLLVDLREVPMPSKRHLKTKALTPSAQFLVLFHLLHIRRKERAIANVPLKEIAKRTGYTPMAITKAVNLLEHHEIIETRNHREKQFTFNLENNELWNDLINRELLINPVVKTLYSDEPITHQFLLTSNESALAAYTNYNWEGMGYSAIDKTAFYAQKRANALPTLNEKEGQYALEVWQYNPQTLVDDLPTEWAVVDPLSLYLSLKDHHDERIEMALEQLLEEYTW